MTLHCSMAAGLSMSSYTMYWYRQLQSGAPIRFLKKEFDASTETEQFSVTLDASQNSFALRATNLTLADSGTYYCAASHGVSECRCRCTTTLPCGGGTAGRVRKALWFLYNPPPPPPCATLLPNTATARDYQHHPHHSSLYCMYMYIVILMI